MPQLMLAIGYSVVLAVLSSSLWLGQTFLVSLEGTLSQVAQSESQLPFAYSQVNTQVAAGVQASPNTALSSAIFGSGWMNQGQKVTAVIEGDTQTGAATGNDLAANVQQNPSINERRIAVDVTIAGGNPPVSVTQRLVYRAFNFTPYVELLGVQTLGAASDRLTAPATDNGGCAGTGAGCDTNAVQAADDQRLGAGLSCVLGSNSGSCPPGNVFDTSVYGNKPWTNNQQSEGNQ